MAPLVERLGLRFPERAMNLSSDCNPRSPARRLLVQLFCASALLAGCGGGGGDPSVATAGTSAGPTSFAAGPITGFGSVIVNGVRFDDSKAVITDDDGNSATKDMLRLGMGAEVHGGAITDDGTGPRAVADRIAFGSALVGPVSAIDATARSLTLLGQTVLVVDTTVLDDRLVGGFAAIAVGMVLEVHGTLDAATGAFTATRLEPKAANAEFKLRGIVANLDSTAKTFTIGGALVSYASVTTVPANLANGLLLTVRVQAAQVAGAWVATRLGMARQVDADADEAHLEGSITTFTSTASFSVNGIPVDASAAAFPAGTSGIVLGAQVEVEGTSRNGVVIATKVSIETHEAKHAEGFELHGAITAIDTTAKTFVLRGVTVSYAAAGIEYKHGSAAQLAVGVQLEVRGALSTDGTMLQATRISFGD
jgi:Domain of unknown function (DUF5666)